MKKLCLSICLLLASNLAFAQPPAHQEKSKGHEFVSQLQTVGKNMRSGASELVMNAMGFIGVPYRYGGNSVDTGFDCSGFVRAAFQHTVGKILPRRAADQAAATQQIDRSQLKPGDLVFFNTMRRAFSHVGIYVGDGKFVHSPRTGASIRIDSMDNSYWKPRFDGARRVFTEAHHAVSTPMSQQVIASGVAVSELPDIQELILRHTQNQSTGH